MRTAVQPAYSVADSIIARKFTGSMGLAAIGAYYSAHLAFSRMFSVQFRNAPPDDVTTCLKPRISGWIEMLSRG